MEENKLVKCLRILGAGREEERKVQRVLGRWIYFNERPYKAYEMADTVEVFMFSAQQSIDAGEK